MRKIVIGTALWFATIAGAVALGGSNAHATAAPAADDWPVSRTVVSRMYYDYGDAYALASAGSCTSAATDDSCA